VAFSGYERGNLWVTRDGGGTWYDLSAALPSASARAATMHPRAEFVYAGTEVGLFASQDSGSTWSPTNCSANDPVLDGPAPTQSRALARDKSAVRCPLSAFLLEVLSYD
jgi:photosystem II stability/assembly factor-like uncharacterized protein